MRLIILAAGTGSRLSPLTDDRPKCLVELGGKPLLEWTLTAARAAGLSDIVVVGGYRADQLRRYDVTLLINEDFATTNMVHTLNLAKEHFGDGFIMSYGDIVYTAETLTRLIEAPCGVGVVVDTDWRSYWQQRFRDPLDDAETLKLRDDGTIAEIGNRPQSFDQIDAQYIGLAAFKKDGVQALNQAICTARKDQEEGRNPFGCPREYDRIYMTDLMQGMIGLAQQVKSVPTHGKWVEIDSPHDLAVAETLLKQGRLVSDGNART